jgi:predicted ribosomally synthesized peptide with SipW-like signal peptide
MFALAASLFATAALLGGTGTTAAAWNDRASATGGTLAAGTLGVSVSPADEPSAARKYLVTSHYTVSLDVAGDNLVSELRVRLDEHPGVEGDGVSAAAFLRVGSEGQDVEAGTEVVVGVVAEGGAWTGSPDVPVLEAVDGSVHVPVTITLVQVDRAGTADLLFPGGDLVATVEQRRPGSVTGAHAGLWRDEDSTPVPAAGSTSASSLAAGLPTDDEPAVQEPVTPPASTPAPIGDVEPTAPGDPSEPPPTQTPGDDAVGCEAAEADTGSRPACAPPAPGTDGSAEPEGWADGRGVTTETVVAWLDRRAP